MKQKIFTGVGIAAMMAFLAGCDEVKFGGLLNVIEPMTFTQVRGPSANGVEWEFTKAAGDIVLTPGQFSTKVIMGKSGSKKQLTLEVANANPATVIKLKFDKNIELGENFTLTAAQLGQNFDLTGNLVTKVERSSEQSGRESCTYQYPQTVCRSVAKNVEPSIETTQAAIARFSQDTDFSNLASVPAVPNAEVSKAPGHHPGQHPGHYNTPNCHTVWVSRPGTMFVRYYIETTLRDINAKFVQGEKTLAGYQGNASSSERIYTYQGTCN